MATIPIGVYSGLSDLDRLQEQAMAQRQNLFNERLLAGSLGESSIELARVQPQTEDENLLLLLENEE